MTTAARLDEFPDVPTIGEFVPGYEASAWYGIGAPKGTPADIVDKLNKETNAALADPKIKARLAEFGGTMLAGSPADFGKFIATETEKWGKGSEIRGPQARMIQAGRFIFPVPLILPYTRHPLGGSPYVRLQAARVHRGSRRCGGDCVAARGHGRTGANELVINLKTTRTLATIYAA